MGFAKPLTTKDTKGRKADIVHPLELKICVSELRDSRQKFIRPQAGRMIVDG